MMNDFTKEELELIHDGLSYAAGTSMETGGMMKDILYPVAKKIQSMIDNYCEHEQCAYVAKVCAQFDSGILKFNNEEVTQLVCHKCSE